MWEVEPFIVVRRTKGDRLARFCESAQELQGGRSSKRMFVTAVGRTVFVVEASFVPGQGGQARSRATWNLALPPIASMLNM